MAGPDVMPGQPDQSLLVKAVRQTERDPRMPPRKPGPKLADPDILNRGFRWPTSGAPTTRYPEEQLCQRQREGGQAPGHLHDHLPHPQDARTQPRAGLGG